MLFNRYLRRSKQGTFFMNNKTNTNPEVIDIKSVGIKKKYFVVKSVNTGKFSIKLNVRRKTYTLYPM